jgi:hypothetical protein
MQRKSQRPVMLMRSTFMATIGRAPASKLPRGYDWVQERQTHPSDSCDSAALAMCDMFTSSKPDRVIFITLVLFSNLSSLSSISCLVYDAAYPGRGNMTHCEASEGC